MNNMLSYVGFGIMGVAFLLRLLNLVTDIVGMIIILVGAFFAIIPLFGKIQFGRRKLISKYKVLPIIDDVYAIKTCDGKVVFKYLDYEDNDKEVIDLLIDRNEVVEIFELEEPILKIYEEKAKRNFFSLPVVETRYIEVLEIPVNTIITK